MSFWQIFSDGEMLSWMRSIGTVVVLVACFGFTYSIVTKFEAGILASVGLIGSVLTLKGYQTKKEMEATNIADTKKE